MSNFMLVGGLLLGIPAFILVMIFIVRGSYAFYEKHYPREVDLPIPCLVIIFFFPFGLPVIVICVSLGAFTGWLVERAIR